MLLQALVFVALSLYAAPSWGALAIDTASSASCAACTSLSWSHTVSGTNRLLVVGLSGYDTADTVTGVTYNSVSMTVVPSSSTSNGNHTVSQYGLIAPSTGANTVLVSVTGQMTDLGAGAVSYTDAHQTTPFGTAVTATGTSTTPSVNVSSAANEIVNDALNILHNGTLTAGAGQAQQWQGIGGFGFIKYAGSTETGSATTTMSWSNSTSQAWAISAVPIKPVAAAATLNLRTLMGVGQ